MTIEEPAGSLEEQIRQAIELTREEQYREALELFEKNLAAVDGGSVQQKRLAAYAFSFYGVCMAKVQRRYGQAVQCCQISLKHNFLDPEHHHNLALVYLERGDRARAVETLNAGLRLDSRNRRIHRVFDEIGRRRPPVIPFLSRNNLLNIWLGKKFRARRD
jgi:tetratricopeptide (TPR) repeat protein